MHIQTIPAEIVMGNGLMLSHCVTLLGLENSHRPFSVNLSVNNKYDLDEQTLQHACRKSVSNNLLFQSRKHPIIKY